MKEREREREERERERREREREREREMKDGEIKEAIWRVGLTGNADIPK